MFLSTLATALIFLGAWAVSAERACPVFCECYAATGFGPSALRATCRMNDVKQMPRMTVNITHVTLMSDLLEFVDGFAFQNAPFLQHIRFDARELMHVSSDTFQFTQKLETFTTKSKRTVHFEAGTFRNLGSLTVVTLVTNLTRIPSKELCEAFNLEDLILTKNSITQISFDPCVEKVWKHLRRLELDDNPLERIHPDDFYYLREAKVYMLSISRCGLTHIPLDSFKYLPHLTDLRMESNKIKYLPPGVFDGLPKLSILDLAGTYISELPFTENSSFISTLKQINLGACRSLNLPFGRIFQNATKLKDLILYQLQIGEIDDSFFSNFVNSPVTDIVLRESKVTSVAPNAFKQFKFLKTLTLNRNNLELVDLYNLSVSVGETPVQTLVLSDLHLLELREYSFKGFTTNNSLEVLMLKHCQIRTIKNNSFAHLGQVRRLDLSKNLLTSGGIESGAFHGLESLQELGLDDNKFTSFPSRIRLGIPASLQIILLHANGLMSLKYSELKEWRNLSKLVLSRNNIGKIGENVFASFNRLKELHLRENRIFSFSPKIFDDMHSLKLLELDKNRIEKMPPGLWQNLSQLESLELQYNWALGAHVNLSTMFVGMFQLQRLKLMQCGIHTLPTSMFTDNRRLNELYLGFNAISSWDPALFKPLQKLSDLLMSNNKITSLSETSLMHLVSLKRLDLSRNPIVCSCDLLWFRQWLYQIDLYLVQYSIKQRYVCEAPEDIKGTPLVDFHITEDDCVSNWILELTLVLCSCLLAIGILVSVVCRYWWYVRYYFFLMRSRRRKMQDALSEKETFKYDAYVCYHNTSRHWVIKKLLPELEYKGGIRLCLHDRDWLAGPTIIENIVESIECSRKTLLLVNNEFARSDWCREETSLAYHRLVQEQRNLLTVVLLEDVRQENMDKTLRSILTKRVYLRFADGKHKEAKFWKALKAALGKASAEVEYKVGVSIEMETLK